MRNFEKLQSHLNDKSDLRKKVCLSVIFVLAIISSSIAQNGSGFGIKGGVNYNANGDYFNSISNTSDDPTRAIGYHIGIFGKLGDKIYIKPELVYTKTTSEYDTGDFEQKRIDAPVLVGIKVLGPISVFAGPAFQYILDSDIDNVRIGDIENDFTVGLNFGVALNFDSVGIDLRYERGFTDNEATIITNNSTVNIGRLDTRSNQLILSLSIKL
ncbi:outer membrane beta-barrel protein [uncultured Lacinutrix sp.]|uniref:outer membrane beta-barrel protein n=1 Tax=uncultured Lacinutrix sp. TaxID=574032 RepID=UPI00260A7151|nr:outer membrane beta-barrel protein [uncultured Lacinutrix sp.]